VDRLGEGKNRQSIEEKDRYDKIVGRSSTKEDLKNKLLQDKLVSN